MSNIVPITKPKQAEEITRQIIADKGVTDKVVLVGVRGYYKTSMGNPNQNDINMYDDAIFLVSPTAYATFNANTDPSFVRNKKGKALAKLNTGVYRFYKGKHKGRYWALRAHPELVKLPCTRDGVASMAKAINIHKGGTTPNPTVGVTWSEGCQTIIKTQWDGFINLVYSEMARHGQKTVPYILIENV